MACLLLSWSSSADSVARTTSTSSVFIQQDSSAPDGCTHRIYPTFYTNETKEEFVLVVHAPNISSRHLDVHVDFQTNALHVLGWYDPSNVVNETTSKDREKHKLTIGSNTKCLFQEWYMDTTNAVDPSDSALSLYNLVMHRDKDQIVITLPKQTFSLILNTDATNAKNTKKESTLETQTLEWTKSHENSFKVRGNMSDDTFQEFRSGTYSKHDRGKQSDDEDDNNPYRKTMDSELALIMTTEKDCAQKPYR
jgi:hypothetical protein